MIPIRQNRVRVVDRIRRLPLGEPVSLTLTMDEEWSPRIQGDIVVGDDVLAALARPGGDLKLGQLQADVLALELSTQYRERFALAALTAKVGGSVKRATTRWKGKPGAVTGEFGRPWNPGERIEPLSSATAKWGGKTKRVTQTFAPRVGVREITRALRVPGGSYLIPPTDTMFVQLRIRKYQPNPETGTTTLTLASEEVRLHDFRRTYPAVWVNPFVYLRDLVAWMIAELAVVASFAQVLELAHGKDVRIESGQEWEPGMTAWEFLHPILEAVDWTFYADEVGRYRLEPRTPSAASVQLDPELNLIKTEYVDDRAGDFYDGAVIEYTDADPLNMAQRFDSYAPWATRIAHETRPGIKTMPGAARAFVERAQTRGKSGSAEALTLLPLRPGQRIATYMGVREANGETFPYFHYGTIRALTHNLPAGEMSISLRDIIT